MGIAPPSGERGRSGGMRHFTPYMSDTCEMCYPTEASVRHDLSPGIKSVIIDIQ